MENLEIKEYMTQGVVFSSQGNYEEAISYYEKAEKIDPMDTDVYIAKGIAYANMEQLEAAKQQFEKSLKINRKLGLAYFHLGSIAILEDDVALGFEYYNNAVANGYDNAQMYYSLGLLYEENGDWDMAIRNYSKAIQRDALRPDIRIRKARLLEEMDQLPEALQTLDEMILSNPDYFEGYHMKFGILLKQKKYDEAKKLMDDAIALFPKDPYFVIDRATLLLEQGKLQEALDMLTNLEGAEEVDFEAKRKIYMSKAQIFSIQENLKAAEEELKKGEKLSEQEGEFDEEMVFLLMNVYFADKDYEKTLDLARKLFEKTESGYIKETARYYVPLALKMLNRSEEALPLYEEAINEYRNQSLAFPAHLDAYLFRIMCLRDIEKYDKALELLDYVTKLQPESTDVLVVKASVLEAMGKEKEAEEEVAKIKKINPDFLQ